MFEKWGTLTSIFLVNSKLKASKQCHHRNVRPRRLFSLFGEENDTLAGDCLVDYRRPRGRHWVACRQEKKVKWIKRERWQGGGNVTRELLWKQETGNKGPFPLLPLSFVTCRGKNRKRDSASSLNWWLFWICSALINRWLIICWLQVWWR